MFRNYVLTAFRNLQKQKFFTFINIAGLSVGVAGCLIILLFVVNELSYDLSFAKGDRIYRLNTEIKFGTNHFKVATGYPVMAELFRMNYPEIESVVRFRNWGWRNVRKTDKAEKTEENVIWADSTFFDVFTVPLLEGDAKSALREPNTIAISRKMATKYFKGESAVGQTLIIDDNSIYQVTAVYEDLPATSHFHFDILRSTAGLEDAKSVTLIGGNEFHVYVLLREGVTRQEMESKFPAFTQKYVMPQIVAAVGGDPSLEKFTAAGNKWNYTLINVKDIHLHGDLLAEFEANGNITYVYLFSSIAIFILAIACINFMNLSTARSANRAREVGVRKVLGSLRGQLIKQFLAESFLLTLSSFALALMIAYLLLPAFNTLADKNLSLPLNQAWFYAMILGATIAVSLLAGLYPAFFLSAFKPAAVLKGKLAMGMKSGGVRSGLVVFQFLVSAFLIIGTITINQQLSYIQSKRLGFDKDQLIVVKEAYLLGDNIQAFKDDVLRNSAIQSGTISGFIPVAGGWRSGDTYWKDGVAPTESNLEDMVNIQSWSIDHEYIPTFKMKLKSGRMFSEDFPSDSSAIILNETAINRFKFDGDPIGKKISHFNGINPDGSPDPDKIQAYTIIGVIEDFHFESLKDNIAPLGFSLGKSNGAVTFRFDATKTSDVIALLEDTWKKTTPGNAFEFSFIDQDFSRMYSAEQKLGTVFSAFAILAIFIACLGLFALTAFTAEQRTKEIGIRKAMGASVHSIVLLLSRDFGKLILIAFILTVPLSIYANNYWLQGYAYKTDIGVVVYLAAGGITLLIALLTMSFQSIKAARGNPIESLRSE